MRKRWKDKMVEDNKKKKEEKEEEKEERGGGGFKNWAGGWKESNEGQKQNNKLNGVSSHKWTLKQAK
jgi:hypothetical protein